MKSLIIRKLAELKKRALFKNVQFDLDSQWIRTKLNKKNCEVSNLPFNHDKGVWYTQSIDRTDNNHGYTKDNCKVILWGMNVGKGSNSYEDLYNVSRAFIKQFEKGIK